MKSYSKGDVILVHYPFSDLSGSKVRPAVIVSAPHISDDAFIVPLTSNLTSLLTGEFILADWKAAKLNVPSAAKRGLYTVYESLIVKTIGKLSSGSDANTLESSLRGWLGIH